MATTSPAALLIVWFSRTGASQQLAASAYDAACQETTDGGPATGSPSGQISPGLEWPKRLPRLLACEQAGPEQLLAAQAYLFVCPENLGSMAGPMKDFFDRCYYPLLDKIQGRPYASIVSAGSDGVASVRQIDRIVTGWRLRQVAPGLIVNVHAQTPAEILAPKTLRPQQLIAARELGAALQSGVTLGIF